MIRLLLAPPPIMTLITKTLAAFILGSAAVVADELPPLHRAAAAGDVQQVRQLLQQGAGPNATTEMNWTPLHAAVAGGGAENYVEVVRVLLAAGARVQVRDGDGRSILCNLHASADAKMVRLLLSAGADANAIDDVLWTAAMRHMPEVYDALAAAGAQLTRGTPLHVAALLGRGEDCDKLLQAGADTEARVELSAFPRSLHELQYCTALHLAALSGSESVCAKLLAAGADPHAMDARGRTPLHFASSAAVCRLLLEKGARAERKRCRGQYPSACASPPAGRHAPL